LKVLGWDVQKSFDAAWEVPEQAALPGCAACFAFDGDDYYSRCTVVADGLADGLVDDLVLAAAVAGVDFDDVDLPVDTGFDAHMRSPVGVVFDSSRWEGN
jgi:hypothetical protein